ncbi:MAG: zinc-binding dehydrogenase [Actinobacteria bacterium]|nr:zinc-binding dehydrogenase [Actinomycetota bacterium]
MRAWVTTPETPYIRMADVDAPVPRPDQALVKVSAVSVNRGELVSLPNFWDVRMDGSTMSMPMGSVPGYELAGTVAQAAADGTGPSEGTRVSGFPARGTWAQFAAVPTCLLGRVDDQVSDEQAATLPVAGATAYRALRRGGLLLGKQVVITGAAGGVGVSAVQLAKLAGAEVTAIARNQQRQDALIALGADRVASELSADGPREFDLVMEAVGGTSLGAAFQRVARGGTIVQYGEASQETVTFPAGIYGLMPGVRYEPFLLFPDLMSDVSGTTTLELLSQLVAAGKLDPVIADTLDWRDAPNALKRLGDRDVIGKIVLRVS